jgi:hypothetical protein
MTGDCHVRFYESQGLKCPWPLTKTIKHNKTKHKKKGKK